MTAGFLVLGVSIWQMRRGRDPLIFRASAKLAIVVVVPVSMLNLAVGSEFGVQITDVQPMKIAAAEALWETEQPAGFTLFQIGGFTEDDQDPAFNISIPRALSFLATNSLDGKVVGMNELQSSTSSSSGPVTTYPTSRSIFWSMRAMAYLGTLSLLLALWAAYLLRKERLGESKWFARAAVAGIALPYVVQPLGLGSERGGTTTVGGLRPAQDRGRRIPDDERRHGCREPHDLRRPLRRARRTRLHPDAPLRDASTCPRPTRRRTFRRVARLRPRRGTEMSLETVWFILICVLWTGYLVLEGFDFGVGMLAAVPRRSRR